MPSLCSLEKVYLRKKTLKRFRMAYKFLEGLTVADVAFEATGSSLEEMFAAAGLAFAAAQVKDIGRIKPVVKKKISVKADNVEELLFKFLDELVFLKDKDQLLFSKFSDIKVDEKSLECTAHGEKLDAERHQTLAEVKAVTMHHFSVKKKGNQWKARVVLDV